MCNTRVAFKPRPIISMASRRKLFVPSTKQNICVVPQGSKQTVLAIEDSAWSYYIMRRRILNIIEMSQYSCAIGWSYLFINRFMHLFIYSSLAIQVSSADILHHQYHMYIKICLYMSWAYETEPWLVRTHVLAMLMILLSRFIVYKTVYRWAWGWYLQCWCNCINITVASFSPSCCDTCREDDISGLIKMVSVGVFNEGCCHTWITQGRYYWWLY